ncbi:MAG: PAS domain S-box protein, partial [Deltaproteobacteria bacterium]|nr:PAS domain S-box protein [Deltaproteobacteria bacterium]
MMKEQARTNPELIEENALLKQRIQELEQAESERKRAEEALREAYRRLDDIIDFLPDATFVINLNGKVTAWNRAIEQMTRVPKEEMIGKGDYEYAIPFYGQRRPILIDLAFLSDDEFEKGKYDAVFRNADTLFGEVYVPKTYGGKGAYLFATVSKLRDASGNFIGAIESIRDITYRKSVEVALLESEEKYRILFEGINDAVFVHDLDEEGLPGRFLQVNDVACRRMGYTREELLSLTPRDITMPEEYERIADKRIGLASQGDILAETVHVTKDGRRIPVESNIRQFQYLGKQVALSISRDITDRKRSEEVLRATEERYRSLASSVDSMYLVDRDCRYMFMNEGCRMRFGVPLEDIIGKRYDDFHTGENSKEFAKTVEEVFKTGKPIQMEHQSERDQSYRLRTFSPAMDQEGKSISAVTIVSKDISDRKRIEAERLELERLVMQSQK